MNSKTHYLSKLQPGTMPKRILTLGVSVLPVREPGNGLPVPFLKSVAWYLGEYTTGITSWGKTGWHCGRNGIELTRLLKKTIRGKGQTLLWTINLPVTLAALDFWQAIESGLWLLKTDKWTGTVIVSDPPNMLVVKAMDCKDSLRCLDLKNIGIETIDALRETVNADGLCTNDWPDCGFDAEACAESISNSIAVYLERWFGFITKHDLGKQKNTIAGQARTAFRTRFLKWPMLCHRNAEATQIEQDALFQGRSECFRYGKVHGPIYHIDFQSFYPAVVRNTNMPVRMKYVVKDNFADIVQAKQAGWEVIAECEIETDKPDYPCRHNGYQVFPTGRFQTTLCFPELQHALSRREVISIKHAALYHGEPIFAEWVDWCLGVRQEAKRKGDKVAEHVVKLLTNSLWGSFAKRKRLWQSLRDLPTSRPWGNWFEIELESGIIDHYRSIGWLGQKCVDYGFDDDSLPAITAYISSYGRNFLRRVIDCCRRENIYYVCTDGIYCNKQAMSILQSFRLLGNDTIGKARIVSVHPWIVIHGIHCIENPCGIMYAGMQSGAERQDDDSYQWNTIESVTGSLNRGHRPEAFVVPRTRKVPTVYHHGRVCGDGSIDPIRLYKPRKD